VRSVERSSFKKKKISREIDRTREEFVSLAMGWLSFRGPVWFVLRFLNTEKRIPHAWSTKLSLFVKNFRDEVTFAVNLMTVTNDDWIW
jgi:hypothetical protein